MTTIRVWLKLILLVLVMMGFMMVFYTITFFKTKTIARGFSFRRRYCRAALWILGIDYKHQDDYSENGACLYVSNHRSLLDPLIQLGYIDAFIVSKAEVGDYPLIGRGARETGIILVHRDSQSSRKAALGAIEEKLRAGFPVLIYPEGTTYGGELTKDFRRGAIEMAYRLGVPIVPVVIEYPLQSDYWVDGSFMEYFIQKFSRRGKHQVWGRVGPAIANSQVKSIATDIRHAIENMMQDIRQSLPDHRYFQS